SERERQDAEVALRERTRRLEAVQTVAVEIAREHDLATLLGLIIRRAMSLVNASWGDVYEWDPTQEVLLSRAWEGRSTAIAERRLRPGQGGAGLAAERRQSVLINDYRAWPGALERQPSDPLLTAFLAEPIVYQDRLVGVLCVGHETPGAAFTEQDQQQLNIFAAQAAIAIENARLYADLDRRLERLQTLIRLTQLISSALDMEELLHEIAKAAAGLVGAPEASFWVADEAAQRLEVRAWANPAFGRG